MTSYVRLYQPDTPTSAFAQSSYLRLGAYAPTDEQGLVTGLTTTTSSNSSSSISAVSSANSSATPSSEMGDETASVSSQVTSTSASSNNGLLAYTDADFQANVQGAALMKIGKGHTTDVTAGDAKYTVDQGSYTLSAQNNVNITAGSDGTPANLVLTASDYIKQTANGPLSVTTFGNSDSQTIGDSASFYLGTKFECTIGTNTSIAASVSLSVFLGYQMSVGMCELSITWVFSNSYVWGSQIQLQEGDYLKMVGGEYINTVVGDDVKVAETSTKALTGDDFEICADYMKMLGTNGTVCDYDLKKVNGKLSTADQKATVAQIKSKIETMKAESGDFEMRTKASIFYM